MRTESGIYRENEPVDRVSDKRRRKCVSTFYIARTQVREPASLSVVSIATKLVDFISLLATFTEVVVRGGGGGGRRKLLSRQMRCHGDNNNNIYILTEANMNVRAKGHLIIKGETLKAIIPENNSI